MEHWYVLYVIGKISYRELFHLLNNDDEISKFSNPQRFIREGKFLFLVPKLLTFYWVKNIKTHIETFQFYHALRITSTEYEAIISKRYSWIILQPWPETPIRKFHMKNNMFYTSLTSHAINFSSFNPKNVPTALSIISTCKYYICMSNIRLRTMKQVKPCFNFPFLLLCLKTNRSFNVGFQNSFH